MTRLEVSILELQLGCGETLLEVSLWRDQALYELHEGDIINLSHFRGSVLSTGKGMFQSSNYMFIKVLMIIYLSIHLYTHPSNVVFIIGETHTRNLILIHLFTCFENPD